MINPAGFRTIGEYPNLIRAMGRAGWSAGRIEKIPGLNWLTDVLATELQYGI